MGHTIKTYEGLPVFEAIDNLQIEDNTQELGIYQRILTKRLLLQMG